MPDQPLSKATWFKEAIIYREYQFQPDFPILAMTTNGRPTGQSRFHFHNSPELGYFLKGSMHFDIEGRQYTCSEGDLVFIPPFYTHSCRPVISGAEVRIHYLYLEPEELLASFYPYGIPSPMVWYKNHSIAGVVASSEYPLLTEIVPYVVKELNDPSPASRIIVSGLVQTLLILLSRRFSSQTSLPDRHSQFLAQIFPALNYMNANYASPITTEQLAGLCYMSTGYFRRKFNEVLSASPGQYLKMIRITNACDLLHETEQSIADIALSVGFSSLSCFYQYFSKYLHTTPTAYRKERRTYKKEKTAYKPWDFGNSGLVAKPPFLTSTNTGR